MTFQPAHPQTLPASLCKLVIVLLLPENTLEVRIVGDGIQQRNQQASRDLGIHSSAAFRASAGFPSLVHEIDVSSPQGL